MTTLTPMDGKWWCQDCGWIGEPEKHIADAQFRWAGDHWQHYHGYPAGHGKMYPIKAEDDKGQNETVGRPDSKGDTMTIHELKCWPEAFVAIVSGAKTTEVRTRKGDEPDFDTGDVLVLREYVPRDVTETPAHWTGRTAVRSVTHVIRPGDLDQYQSVTVKPDLWIMSLGRLTL